MPRVEAHARPQTLALALVSILVHALAPALVVTVGPPQFEASVRPQAGLEIQLQ